jgi:hypothetical protein
MTKRSEQALADQLAKCSGLVVGADGRGGSGTCVQLEDGTVALLTARHVVLECLRNTGRVAIAAYGVNFHEPRSIRMDSSQHGDAALLVFKNLASNVQAIPFAEWTDRRTDIQPGQRTLACGFPSVLKKVEGRTVMPTFAWLGDNILTLV